MSDTVQTTPTIPPVPKVPIVDERGYVAREWWRWFYLVFSVAQTQKQQIETVTTEVDSLIYLDGTVSGFPIPETPLDLGAAAVQGLTLGIPPDPPVIGEALRALSLSSPPDPPVSADALAMQAMMLGLPEFALPADLAAIDGLTGTGLVARVGTNLWATRTLTGTADRITVADGDGVAGNPTVDIAATYVGQASITTLGTVATGTWNATTIAVDHGGTGQTSYTNGQLLIGNSTGNTLAKGTLTQPAAGITITGGAGTITFALANDLAALEAMSGTGLVARTASETYAQRTITGTANKIDVTNGDGIAGNPTLTISRSPLFIAGQIDLTQTTDEVIAAEAGMIVPDYYEIGAGVALEIGADAVMEIT